MPTAAVASLAAVLLIGIPGTAIGATTAQPGESLWKVKLGLEQVRLALSTTPGGDAEVHVDLASARLAELAGLVGDDAAPAVVGDVSDDLGDHALAASDNLEHVRPTAVRTQLQRRILDLTEQQVAVMDSLLRTDCTRNPDRDCVALAETRGEMVELQESADDVIALAGSVRTEVATPVPSSPPSVVQAEVVPPATAAQQDDLAIPEGAPGVSADEPPSGTDGPAPSAAEPAAPEPSTVTPTPKPTPSPKPTPKPTPTPKPAASPGAAAAGSPATETPVTAEPGGTKRPGGQPLADDAAAAKGD